MALLKGKPESKEAMRRALQSVNDYIEGQQAREKAGVLGGWWPPLPDTIKEVRHALGLEIYDPTHLS